MKRQGRVQDLAQALVSELVEAGTRATMCANACRRTLPLAENLRRDRIHTFDYMSHRARARADADTNVADGALALASSLDEVRDKEHARNLVGALASAQGRARELSKELVRVTNLTMNLSRMLALGLASCSDYALANIRALASNHTLARFSEVPADDYARARSLTNGELDLIRVLDQILRYHLTLIISTGTAGGSRADIALAVHRAADLDVYLDRALGAFTGVNRVLARANDLQCALEADRVASLAANPVYSVRSAEYGLETAEASGGGGSMPGPVSRGLVSLAIQMLPSSQRPRYRVEFHAELVELSSRERLGYARRVLTGGWELRRALIEAIRNAEVATRRAEQ